MRKIKKKLKKPRRPWDKERMKEESMLMKTYGLRRKREIWKTESILRSFRRRARELAAKKDKVQEKVLLEKLDKMGLLSESVSLDDVLGLSLENILERRLQTLTLRKNLANTPKHARQLITHGHIAVDGRRIIYPGFLVPRDLENKISVYEGSKIKVKSKSEK